MVRACLWLSDIENLRALHALLDGSIDVLLDRLCMKESTNIVGKWSQLDKKINSQVASPVAVRGTPTPSPLSRVPGKESPRLESSPVPLSSPLPGMGSAPVASLPVTKSATPTPAPVRLRLDIPSSPTIERLSKKHPLSSPVTPGTKRRRSTAVTQQCKDRDGMCIITSTPAELIDVCHLYPALMGNRDSPGVIGFWRTIRLFWTKEKVDSWYNAIFGDGADTEKIENMICMNSFAHRLHGKSFFAFEPLDRDPNGKWLTLRFWWLKQQQAPKDVSIGEIPDFPDNEDPTKYGVNLWDMISHRRIISGDTFTLKTPDPVNLPLPDTRIMSLQWHMNRVAAMAAAAEPQDPDDYSDDDDDDDGLDYFARPYEMDTSSLLLPSQSSFTSVTDTCRPGDERAVSTHEVTLEEEEEEEEEQEE
ncbi:hypothetical protein BO70DRAFT_360784 [Aspergillus heteromorphus CBS 117.55]|uniref:HNH nuclease domain-containing protein n=1 Tax=Aspergillus heteromorphus CBS 117.55 TaxID=1448321 RepID=A0A317WHK3_9EURO|nr:uncharacterized protein BO70DRAFT_360784 [Aspergillus heteromorphus CBS 117.55]PWY85964.1 hypothetical protein BO70DRAFT_360784 [Aspergillus heteromorphus CBS 117.55]